MNRIKYTQCEVEEMIDQIGLNELLAFISDICYSKADHLRENWQDETTAKEWDKAAERIDKVIPWILL